MSSVNGIAQAATAISNAQLANKVDFAVLKKQQEASQQAGDAAVQLIEAAAAAGRQADSLELSEG
ncbi:hypothetical protein Poly24_47840 [Rosistilla carotiformis]|uniref:Motility protein n=1 Tax=Rosistilla carotiformis TaxID=2528017 RepID=A0A518JZT0_9BACT|nr:YjfB family protein [Rosistilla carotiformis]QDV71051.1 hypothetical protein Poly24_47840 [Rosistilla carotiformis]